MRPKLRISKIAHTWRWFYEDYDGRYPDRVLDFSTADYPSWPEAEVAARAAHPEAPDVVIHAVRGYGTDYPDSTGSAHISWTPR